MENNKKIGIYKITNPENKIYIGQSNNIKRRWNYYINFRFISQAKLHESFKKYGYLNHTFEIIEECSIELLNERERYWQDYYNVLNNGLNSCLVNTNFKKGVISEERKKQISIIHKGKKTTEDAKIKMRIKNSTKLLNIIENKIYYGFKEASDKCGISRRTLTRNPKKYNFIILSKSICGKKTTIF
jgi:group I intron endonuclease